MPEYIRYSLYINKNSFWILEIPLWQPMELESVYWVDENEKKCRRFYFSIKSMLYV